MQLASKEQERLLNLITRIGNAYRMPQAQGDVPLSIDGAAIQRLAMQVLTQCNGDWEVALKVAKDAWAFQRVQEFLKGLPFVRNDNFDGVPIRKKIVEG